MSEISIRDYPDFEELDDGFKLFSPAKVNLSLRVLGKRADGYHELETVFQELDWSDEIEFRESSGFSLEVQNSELRADESNLIVKAARALSQAAGVPCTGSLRLQKNLPMQGGVGGGSSNAAITLIGLNRLWNLNWPEEKLDPIAKSLGADCAFFLYGGLASATGRGDVITPLDGRSDGVFVLVCPSFGVETAWAFSQVGVPLTEVEKNVIFSPLWLTGQGESHPAQILSNDLENIVFQRYDGLRHLRDRLLGAGAVVSLMSGSGSTVFGIFTTEGAATAAASELSRDADYRVKVCRAVARRR
jgi:4-diphosphocytidyl-2-C-methyl-D-erythritol kinase